MTVIEHEAFGAVWIVMDASSPGLTGEVSETTLIWSGWASAIETSKGIRARASTGEPLASNRIA
jgi:hypothetical protein